MRDPCQHTMPLLVLSPARLLWTKSTSFHIIEFVGHNLSRSYGKTNEGIEIEDQIWFITVKGTTGILGIIGTRWSDGKLRRSVMSIVIIMRSAFFWSSIGATCKSGKQNISLLWSLLLNIICNFYWHIALTGLLLTTFFLRTVSL